MTLFVLESIREHRIFGQRRARVRIGAFVLAYVIAFATFPFGSEAHYGWSFALAVVAAAAMLATAALLPWRRLPPTAGIVPILLYLTSVAALRDAHAAAASGYAPMLMLAAVWVAIFGNARLLAAVVGAIALTIGLPVFLVGAPLYPDGELRRAFLMAMLAAVVGAVIQALVRALVAELERRERAEQQLNQLRASEIHDDIVQAIAAAQIGMSVHDRATADRALAHALSSAQELVSELFASSGRRTAPGELRRDGASPSPPPPG